MVDANSNGPQHCMGGRGYVLYVTMVSITDPQNLVFVGKGEKNTLQYFMHCQAEVKYKYNRKFVDLQ